VTDQVAVVNRLSLQKNRPPAGDVRNLGSDRVPANLQNGRDDSVRAVEAEDGDVEVVVFERLGESDGKEAKPKVSD